MNLESRAKLLEKLRYDMNADFAQHACKEVVVSRADIRKERSSFMNLSKAGADSCAAMLDSFINLYITRLTAGQHLYTEYTCLCISQ